MRFDRFRECYCPRCGAFTDYPTICSVCALRSKDDSYRDKITENDTTYDDDYYDISERPSISEIKAKNQRELIKTEAEIRAMDFMFSNKKGKKR